MLTLEKTVTVPPSRRVALSVDLPKSVPEGRTSVVLVFPTPSVSEDAPWLSALKAEAKQKTAERLANPGKDCLRNYAGCLAASKAFEGDPVAIQRKMRDEW